MVFMTPDPPGLERIKVELRMMIAVVKRSSGARHSFSAYNENTNEPVDVIRM